MNQTIYHTPVVALNPKPLDSPMPRDPVEKHRLSGMTVLGLGTLTHTVDGQNPALPIIRNIP